MDIELRVKNLIEACEHVTMLQCGSPAYAYWDKQFENAKRFLIEEVKQLEEENARMKDGWMPMPGLTDVP